MDVPGPGELAAQAARLGVRLDDHTAAELHISLTAAEPVFARLRARTLDPALDRTDPAWGDHWLRR